MATHLIRHLTLRLRCGPVGRSKAPIVEGLLSSHELCLLVPLCVILTLLLILLDEKLHPLQMVAGADLRRSLIHFSSRLEVDCHFLSHSRSRCFLFGLDLRCLCVLCLLYQVEDVVLFDTSTTLTDVVSLAHLRGPQAFDGWGSLYERSVLFVE